MATAMKKSRGVGQLARRARAGRAAESMEFVIFEDNGGGYRWRIVAGDGVTLARSGGFASYDCAEQAALAVRGGAASAQIDRPAGKGRPVDLATRGDRPNDDLDAERWLDESGASPAGVVRWPAQR